MAKFQRYSIRKKIIKYYKSRDILLQTLLQCGELEKISIEDKIKISGLLNEAWQNWIKIYRTLWLTYYFGGDTLISRVNKNEYCISNFLITDTEAIALMKIMRKNKPVLFYQESTWGSIESLENVSNSYPDLNRANVIGASISLYGDYIKDFQMIRNNMTHLTEEGFFQLKEYIISRNYNTPVKYYNHNHPVNFLYYRIGTNLNYAYEEIFEQLDQMINIIFLVNQDL